MLRWGLKPLSCLRHLQHAVGLIGTLSYFVSFMLVTVLTSLTGCDVGEETAWALKSDNIRTPNCQ